MRLVTTVFILLCASLRAGTPAPEWTALGFDGRGCDWPVNASVQLADGRLMLGGGFSACDDVDALGLMVFDPLTGLFSAPANDLKAGTVNALALHGNALMVGGNQLSPLGIGDDWGFAILQLDTGQWSTPINALAVAIVEDLAVVDGEIYLNSSQGLLRFDPVTNMAVEVLGGPTGINAMTADGGQLLVAGGFVEIGGVSASGVARYDPQTGNWGSLGSSLNDVAFAVTADDDAIYVGGLFSVVNGQPTDRVARYDRVGDAWQALGMGNFTGGSVDALAVANGDLFAAGSFASIDGVLANNIARYDSVSNQWQPLGAGLRSTVAGARQLLRTHDDQVYAGGSFQQAGGEAQNSIARFDAVAGQWLPLGAGGVAAANGGVDQIIGIDDQVFLVGRFSEIGGVSALRIAQMDCSSFQASALGGIADHQITGAINAVVHHQGWLYIGGSFSSVAGISAPRLARYHLATGVWEAVGDAPDGSIESMYLDGDNLYVGGFFQNLGALAARRVARLDLNTLQWHTLGSGAQNGTNGFVEAFQRVGDGIFVGGSFQEAGGQSAGGFVLYLPDTDSWVYPGGEFNDFILTMKEAQGGLYVGGNFQFVDGVPTVGIARLDLATGAWSAPSGPNQSFFTSVQTLLERNGQLLVGGLFGAMAGIPMKGIGSLNPATQEWTALGTGVELPSIPFLPSGEVDELAVCGDRIIVGGGFQRANEETSTGLAFVRLPGPIFIDDFE
ncbi:MAG: hypothetical protein KDI71_19070 [Xanthomonadales bacterium]|nr:hypothetical protein [Xanthomonadales bacterium]